LLTIERLAPQCLVGAVADQHEVAVDRSTGLDVGLVDAADIAVADLRVIEPTLPFDGLPGERALAKRLQLLVISFAEQLGDGLANDLFGRHPEIAGIFPIGIEMATVAVDKGNACGNRVEGRQQLLLVDPWEAAGLAIRGCRSSRVAHIHVAGSADRLNDLRLCRVALDFLAEPGHADVDAAVEGLPVAPMRQLEKLVAPQ
jgi:hypothetical protein